MPQGKVKGKAKSPKKAAAKKGRKPASKGAKAITPKKAKAQQAAKLKKVITKTVNAAAEEEIRAIAQPKKAATPRASPKKGGRGAAGKKKK